MDYQSDNYIQPFNKGYIWKNTSDNLIIADDSISVLNTYVGEKTQQATSVVTQTDQDCYQLEAGCFSVYGFEVGCGIFAMKESN